jgi:valyl-tRNA synthetase
MLEKNYDAQASEMKWKEFWEKEGIYKFDANSSKPAFTIDTPPPTVSGSMHIGHAFSYSQQDFIARYKRMAGFNVYYPFGTDDNGLPTERLVEKLKNVKSTRMERVDFIKLCRDTIAEIEPEFVEDWKRIGMSCDFSEVYSTIDQHCIKTSQASFLDLFKKNLVYKRKSPSMWCVTCQTAIAQAELEDKELPSTFNDVKFKTKDGHDIIIGTTRPELIPACVALFVHPEDERYKHLHGKTAIVPIFHQEVKIMADESANPEKGSGMLMICSYGDRFDADAIKRKNLHAHTVIAKDGKMNENAKQFAGLKIKDARIAILKELEEKGLLLHKKPITHAVNVHDKCGTEIEFLETEQWFVKVIDNKEKFIEAGRKIKWHPDSMRLRYEHWVTNLNWDWCISRQRHFGVGFPVWYSKKTGEIITATLDELPVDPLSQFPKHLPAGHTHDDLIPEKDVMDTWATSSVSPMIITNWIKDDYPSSPKEVEFKEYFPTSLRPQAHDIIRTWAFYTIVKGIYHTGQPPWENIIISGNVADPKGEKMSKSKGNVVYPKEIIAKFSGDVLRFWAASTKLGEDLAYQEKELVAGKKLVNKMWNAASLCYQHLNGYEHEELPEDRLEVTDKWLLAEYNNTIKRATAAYESYNPNEGRRAVEDFFWRTFCDNYLEIVKYRLYAEGDDEKTLAAKKSAQYTLYTAFLGVLKMSSPIMCFVTEELYHSFYSKRDEDGFKSIHLTKWPQEKSQWANEEARMAGEAILAIISEARKFKTQNGMTMKDELSHVTAHTGLDFENLDHKDKERIVQDIKQTAKVHQLIIKKGEETTVEITK